MWCGVCAPLRDGIVLRDVVQSFREQVMRFCVVCYVCFGVLRFVLCGVSLCYGVLCCVSYRGVFR